MKELKIEHKLKNLSMGMSADYLEAIENSSNFIRIGTIFLVKGLKKFYFIKILVLEFINFKSIKKSFFLSAMQPRFFVIIC